MMKSIGSQIGLPFLSQDEDARLQFRSGKNGIKRLAVREAIPVHDVGYWSQYWMLFESSADVHSLISTGEIRAALHQCPRNVSTLITTLSSHLFSTVPSSTFPTAASSSISPIPLPNNLRRTLTNARGKSNLSTPDPTREVLNCLRVLGRVLPVVYEAETENVKDQDYRDVDGDPPFGQDQEAGEGEVDDGRLKDHFAWHVLWKRPLGPRNLDSQTDLDYPSGREGELAVGDRARDVSMSTPSDPLTQAAEQSERRRDKNDRDDNEEEEGDRQPSLTDKLFGVTVDLLFCAGFTIPESMKGADGRGDKINYVIWEKGVGSTHDIGSTTEFDRNKTEVLRFLLVLLSSTIYTAPHSLPHSLNRPLQYLTHNLERRLVLSLLCSWLNTSLSRGSQSAWGENIPYNHLITRAGEDRRTLVRMSLMVLLVALDHWKVDREEIVETPGITGMGMGVGFNFGMPPSTPGGLGSSVVGETAPKKDENAFRYFLSKLHRREDFEFILTGVLAILSEHTAVNQNVLPGSKKPVDYILEIFMLFWKLLDLNKRFRTYVHESGKTQDIVGHILLCCLEMKDNPAHHGLLRMLSYILQAMSADREFGMALNKPLDITVPVKWNVQGTTADFMVVSMYSIATTPGLNPLFPALTVTISNVAPYLKGLGIQASTRLLQLFKAFSAPNFLLADEGHPRLVYYLLETFNGIIFNQLQENPNIVYAILRSHQDFQDLATFTLMGGLRDIQKRMLTRAANQAATDRKADGPRTSQDSSVQPEKAGLLSEEHRHDTMDLGSPNLAGTLAPTTNHNVTSPLFTPGEAEEDPMATAESNASKQTANPKSEKAKGKMRERSESTSTLAMDTELQRLAMSGIGPNGYVPTQEWVSSWQKGLPLDPVLLTISELLPKVQELQPSTTPGPSRNVISFLKSATLVDVLPSHPSHNPRRFQWSVASTIWLSSLLWGQIYTAALQNFNNTAVRLFGVKQAAPTRREQAIQNVSNRLLSFVNGYPAPMTGIPNGRPSMSGM